MGVPIGLSLLSALNWLANPLHCATNQRKTQVLYRPSYVEFCTRRKARNAGRKSAIYRYTADRSYPFGDTDQGRHGSLDENAAARNRCNQFVDVPPVGAWSNSSKDWQNRNAPIGDDVSFCSRCRFLGLLRYVSPLQSFDQIRWHWHAADRLLCTTLVAYWTVVGGPAISAQSLSVCTNEPDSETPSDRQIRVPDLALCFDYRRHSLLDDIAVLQPRLSKPWSRLVASVEIATPSFSILLFRCVR